MGRYLSRLAASAAAVLLASSVAAAQPGDQGQDVEQLRKQIRQLQEKLLDMEDTAAAGRVTQIGGTRPRLREPELVVRIYDLGDLFTMAPPYDAKFTSDLKAEEQPVFPRPSVERVGGPGGMGGMGGGFFSVPEGRATEGAFLPAPSRGALFQHSDIQLGAGRASIDDLIETVTRTISPAIWDDVGGPASISSIGTSLIVSADVETHDQIDALLNLFRERWGTLRTISVRAYWIYLNDAELGALLADAKVAAGEQPAFGLVDPPSWQKKLEELAAADDARATGYRAVLTCYNGQTVYAISGGQRLAVTQIEPVVLKGEKDGPSGPVAYRPELSVIHEGAALQVTPIASNTGKFVVIDVHSRVVEAREPAKTEEEAPKPAAGGYGGMGGPPMLFQPPPANVVAAIDRLNLAVQRFSTTVRLPVDRPMLVGGMTYQGRRSATDRTLYVFLKVSVQELRDDTEAGSVEAGATSPKGKRPAPGPKPEE